MKKDTDSGRTGRAEGLVGEVIADFFRGLHGQPHLDDAVIQALESLAKDGKLKDASAVQGALCSASSKSNETS